MGRIHSQPGTSPRRALSAPAVSVPSTSCIVTTAATCIVQLSSFPAAQGNKDRPKRAVFRGGWDLPRPPPCPMAAHPSRGDVPWHPMASIPCSDSTLRHAVWMYVARLAARCTLHALPTVHHCWPPRGMPL